MIAQRDVFGLAQAAFVASVVEVLWRLTLKRSQAPIEMLRDTEFPRKGSFGRARFPQFG